MSDMLLTKDKQNRFEEMIERKISEEFDEDAHVLVQSNGRVYIREEKDSPEAADVIENESELFSALSELDFTIDSSPYKITDDNDDISLVGASFYLQRDGW